MPELPEVETIRRQLSGVLVGKVVEKVEVLREKSFSGDVSKVKGLEILEVGRKSKVLEIYFKNSDLLMIIHLKMTGQLVFVDGDRRLAGGHPTNDWVARLPSAHTRVVIHFSDESNLFFNDMRVFGWVRLLPVALYLSDVRKKVPDAVDEEFDSAYLGSVLARSGRSVKLVLLDQDKIGGIGNIYANDALFLAGIDPMRKASEISPVEIGLLVRAVKKVLELGIEYGGASAADEKFVNIEGLGGKYQEHFAVYQRDGQPCKKCGETIKKKRQAGRGTYYCPSCQK